MPAEETIVHIGHGKTGSSAIQSFLALNADLLQEFGVSYPAVSSFAEAAEGRVTTGNRQAFMDGVMGPGPRQLYSSEVFAAHYKLFFKQLMAMDGPKTLICYTRDVFDHFASTYAQKIKRAGFDLDPREYLPHHNAYLSLCDILEFCEANDLPIRLRNYSRLDRPIEEDFLHLALPEIADEILGRAARVSHPVNRSLTRSELALQRLFNRHAEMPMAELVSLPLCNELPEIKGERLALDQETCELVFEKNKAAVAQINRHLPAEEALSLDYQKHIESEDAAETYTFTGAQLEVLAKNIAAALDARQLDQAEVNTLRNVALKHEHKRPANRDEAVALMQMALKFRPDGPVIKRKIEEWRQEGPAA